MMRIEGWMLCGLVLIGCGKSDPGRPRTEGASAGGAASATEPTIAPAGLPLDPSAHPDAPWGTLGGKTATIAVFPSATALASAMRVAIAGKDTAAIQREMRAADVPVGYRVQVLAEDPDFCELGLSLNGTAVRGFVWPAVVRRDGATAAPGPSTLLRPAKAGGWAAVRRPGVDVPNTTENRVTYAREILEIAPGEPKINKPAALRLLEKLKRELVRQGSIEPRRIKVSVVDGGGRLVVESGYAGRLEVHGEARSFPLCSEGLFATSMITGDVGPEEFAKAGVRGLVCESVGCAAAFDTRPTSVGHGGQYTGDACLSMADMVGLATQ